MEKEKQFEKLYDSINIELAKKITEALQNKGLKKLAKELQVDEQILKEFYQLNRQGINMMVAEENEPDPRIRELTTVQNARLYIRLCREDCGQIEIAKRMNITPELLRLWITKKRSFINEIFEKEKNRR